MFELVVSTVSHIREGRFLRTDLDQTQMADAFDSSKLRFAAGVEGRPGRHNPAGAGARGQDPHCRRRVCNAAGRSDRHPSVGALDLQVQLRS